MSKKAPLILLLIYLLMLWGLLVSCDKNPQPSHVQTPTPITPSTPSVTVEYTQFPMFTPEPTALETLNPSLPLELQKAVLKKYYDVESYKAILFALEKNRAFAEYFLTGEETFEDYPISLIADDIYYFPYLAEHHLHGDAPQKIIQAEVIPDERYSYEWWKLRVYTLQGDVFEIFSYVHITKNGEDYYDIMRYIGNGGE